MNTNTTRPGRPFNAAESINQARQQMAASKELRDREGEGYAANDVELLGRTERIAEETGRPFGELLEERLWEIHGNGIKSAEVAPVIEARAAAVRRMRAEGRVER